MEKTINQIEYLLRMYEQNKSFKTLQEIRNLFETYLKKYSTDTTMWIIYAILLLDPPFADPYKALECLNEVLKYDSKNIYATLLIIHMHYLEFGFIPENYFQFLLRLKTSNKKFIAIIEYVKSWYYNNKNDLLYEKSLIKSIKYDQHYVRNYIDLGVFYLKKGLICKGKNLIQQGIKNIKYIFKEGDNIKLELSIEQWINYYFKGTILTQPVVDWIIGYLD